MDANGQRFWLLAEEKHWHTPGAPAPVQWDAERRALRLASRRTPPAWTAYKAESVARLEYVRQARDAFGTTARWSDAEKKLLASGALPEPEYAPVPICGTPGDRTPSDLALGHDGVLYIAVEQGPSGPTGELALFDRRGRRESAATHLEGFRPWRIAADPAGGAWLLDRRSRRLAHTRGEMQPRRPRTRFSAGTFRPCDDVAGPPVRIVALAGATWPEDETVAGIACSPEGRVAVLTWAAGNGEGLLRLLDPTTETLGAPLRLKGARYPFSIAWTSASRVAVLLPRVNEAPSYAVPSRVAGDGEDALPVGDVLPLREHDGPPFLHGVTLPPHYPTRGAPRPLNRLSLPSYAAGGEAASAKLLDGGSTQTVWHRLYLEAVIPAGCGIVLRLAATDEPAAPVAAGEWHEHRFGALFAAAPDRETPVGSWMAEATEVPFARPMLHCPPEPGKAGLWSALVQRPGRRVRSLRGRYLWVRAELVGNGRATPDLAAVRVYGSRFSYAEQYLPELYRETLFGPDADERGRSTPADFLERFLGLFEGVLTPLEDRIAHAHLLTDPRSVPAASLDWLAGWIGFAFDPALSEERRRAMLSAAPKLSRRRGTLRGLALALDLATGGGVRGGEIVVLEDFRLRRTFATILGADLADESDPLLGGIVSSGNSYVGDTLFLGDESRREFLALFGAEVEKTPDEERAIRALYDGLAYRVTVLVHQEVEPQDLGLIGRVLQRETPAHVQARVIAATHPFVVGVAALVGVDTYLGPKPPKRPVRVDVSAVGVRDFLLTPVALDPRLEGGTLRFTEVGTGMVNPRPVARAGADLTVEAGESFTLDASGSAAPPDRTVEKYRWTRRQ